MLSPPYDHSMFTNSNIFLKTWSWPTLMPNGKHHKSDLHHQVLWIKYNDWKSILPIIFSLSLKLPHKDGGCTGNLAQDCQHGAVCSTCCCRKILWQTAPLRPLITLYRWRNRQLSLHCQNKAWEQFGRIDVCELMSGCSNWNKHSAKSAYCHYST